MWLAFLSHLPPLLTFPTILPGYRLPSSSIILEIPLFSPPAKSPRSRARSYSSKLRQVTCFEASHSVFPATAINLSPSTATGPDKVAYPMLKHLPRSGMDFFLHIFNLFWSLHSFPSIWKTFSIISIDKTGKPIDSPASFRRISHLLCIKAV